MARGSKKMNNTLVAEIRRQIGTETMARFVRSLPAFKPDPELPRVLLDLLGKLEQEEGPRAGTMDHRH